MDEVFTKAWFWAVIATWIAVLVLDEVAYYLWKQMNPGHMFSLNIKGPLQTWNTPPGTSYANGYRPAGGQ